MHASRRAALLAAALLCGAGSAHGEDFYLQLKGAPFWLEEADNQGGGIDVRDSTETGYAVAAAVGRRWQGGFRTELEVAYRRNAFDQAEIRTDGGIGAALGVGPLNGATLDLGGKVVSLGLAANVLYDIPTGTAFTPYVGAGLGVARIDAQADLGALRLVDDEDDVLSYQLMAGVDYRISPTWTVGLGYRYFATEDAELRETVLGRKFDSEYSGHAVEIGLRLSF